MFLGGTVVCYLKCYKNGFYVRNQSRVTPYHFAPVFTSSKWWLPETCDQLPLCALFQELKDSTAEKYYLSYGFHCGSLGATLLATFAVILLANKWKSFDMDAPEKQDHFEKENVYNRDNSSHREMVDKPARAELWNGFDRGADTRKFRSHYNSDLYDPGHRHHHHHQHTGSDDRMDQLSTPTRQHYNKDPINYPIRY